MNLKRMFFPVIVVGFLLLTVIVSKKIDQNQDGVVEVPVEKFVVNYL